MVRGRKGQFKELFRDVVRQGFTRARIDDQSQEISENLELDRYKAHTIEIVIDRVVLREGIRERLVASVETALNMSKGTISAEIERSKQRGVAIQLKSIAAALRQVALKTQPNTFSFNSPANACPECHGLGVQRNFVLDLIIPDKTISIQDGGVVPFGKQSKIWLWAQIEGLFEHYGIPLTTPLASLPEAFFEVLMHGSGKQKFSALYTSGAGRATKYQVKWPGVMETLRYWYNESGSEAQRGWAGEFMAANLCTACNGGRLKPENLAIRVAGKNVHEIVTLSLTDTIAFFRTLSFEGIKQTIAEPVVREIIPRIDFLLQVGLGYLSLDRSAQSLSGGESQRIRLATQIRYAARRRALYFG